MVVLDTDLMTLRERGSGSVEADRLYRRLRPLRPAERGVTIISFEEQTRGWMAYIAKARTLAQQVEAYRRLRRHLDMYCGMVILDFDERPAIVYQRLQQARLRIGTMDLKSAAIVLVQDATLLTRNRADLRRVPGLKVEDWTAAEEEE
jgi:tRNA(fMet)-specific endonuclease VapC